uniref:Uncharacterized protein n=1 Tax=Amphimedon queenslandica TaxID=400682 RepID=A0A1X7V680_AMPQE
MAGSTSDNEEFLVALKAYEAMEKVENWDNSVPCSSDEEYLAALREYEVEQMEKYTPETTPLSEQTLKKQAESETKSESTLSSRFGPPVSEDILKKIQGAIPKSTKNSTKWAVNVGDEWVSNRKSQVALPCDNPPSLVNITNVQLSHWMCRLVMEVRNQKGEEYSSVIVWFVCRDSEVCSGRSNEEE